MSHSANADVRADYLINLLKTGSSYRVRIQAAQSLGRIQSKEALPALQDALKDSSPHVVIAVAAALGEIGDPAALPALKAASRRNHSAAVKTQLAATIRLLQAIAPDSADSSDIAESPGQYQFLVKVDAMGNSSTSRTPNIVNVMRDLVMDVLAARAGVEIQSGVMTDEQVRAKLKKESQKGFIISGALIKLQREQDYMVAKIALNVLSNPDYNLVMMPAGEARVPIDFSDALAARHQGKSQDVVAQLETDSIRKAETIVMKKLIENLIGKILEAAPDVL
ncbi:MAG: HEAT repeat domain-containing protein [Deltaproteobacteria bacterium]|nr:HEAT repeat domain-containing protein [Deltaproteobacteria bacterium]